MAGPIGWVRLFSTDPAGLNCSKDAERLSPSQVEPVAEMSAGRRLTMKRC